MRVTIPGLTCWTSGTSGMRRPGPSSQAVWKSRRPCASHGPRGGDAGSGGAPHFVRAEPHLLAYVVSEADRHLSGPYGEGQRQPAFLRAPHLVRGGLEALDEVARPGERALSGSGRAGAVRYR